MLFYELFFRTTHSQKLQFVDNHGNMLHEQAVKNHRTKRVCNIISFLLLKYDVT